MRGLSRAALICKIGDGLCGEHEPEQALGVEHRRSAGPDALDGELSGAPGWCPAQKKEAGGGDHQQRDCQEDGPPVSCRVQL